MLESADESQVGAQEVSCGRRQKAGRVTRGQTAKAGQEQARSEPG